MGYGAYCVWYVYRYRYTYTDSYIVYICIYISYLYSCIDFAVELYLCKDLIPEEH